MSIKKIAISAIITAGLFSSVQATELEAADGSQFTNLCMTALEGNRAKMHNTIKASGYSDKFVARNVQCNGESLLSFVEQHGKNSSSMLKMLDRTSTETSITDLAQNTIEEK
jgi:hypothetical protein